jgi:hypothetical protein
MQGIVSNKNPADCYGVADDAPYSGLHLIITVKQDDCHGLTDSPPRTFAVVTFDESDIFGTFPVTGHPGVFGLWLNASSSSAFAGDPRDLDPSDYIVPNLQPSDAGFMFARGFVWPPGGPGQKPYP